ncbi:hypothetical protein KHM83_10295 [Fusibacter paucivorans]|jgi:hypothetical protein|uniref:Flagellin N-terminal-like domain-containing protein n=1 Tax=Fusibacter paucivorans TaxID=76009 RepID=A0ABS5PPG0_9FIRM|nr:DUF6133 family protein [Fusibacter paucivorans]MBS7527070.1 hypothetical protein [Fusibacter paucivorans]
MKRFMKNVNNFAVRQAIRADKALRNNKGEGYIDTAVKILIAVVLGALLLAGLYALFGEVVMPTLTQRIRDMFNYGGAN